YLNITALYYCYYYYTSTVQPNLSSTFPYWIPVSVSYILEESEPILPSFIFITLSFQLSSPIGEMTAAVPVPKASIRVPFAWASYNSSIVIFLSVTFTPQDFKSSMVESL